MTPFELRDRAVRLLGIKEEMLDLLNEAERLTQGTPEENRAKAYWVGHIRCALDDDHTYLGGMRGTTMEDTARDLMGDACADEENEGA